MTHRIPRVVVVTRPTEFERALARHGTAQQAAFFMRTYGQDIDVLRERHAKQEGALTRVLQDVPTAWRRTRVTREQLDRFLFSPEDVVVAVGQDGLVANVAKYVDGQPVIGVNPDPEEYSGALALHAPKRAKRQMLAVAHERATIEERAMVRARTGLGMELLALNEVFVGHRTHQSARYEISCAEGCERHISSGLIVSTGTGFTGWASSIMRQRRCEVTIPAPCDRGLLFLVREAYASPSSGTGVVQGNVWTGQELTIVSHMNDGGVAFGDGIEDDHLPLPFGMTLELGLAERALRLVVPEQD